MSDVVCTKLLYVTDSSERIVVQVFKPEKIKDREEYRCSYIISSSEFKFVDIKWFSVGIDSVQSIIMAMKEVGHRLKDINQRDYNKRISQFEDGIENDPHLGFISV
jgi:hypothetical protein